MKEQRKWSIFICVCGLISLINGQPFPNFAQPPPQGPGNPSIFQQFLQTRRTGATNAGGAAATAGAGVGTQGTQAQIRTVTVPVLPALGGGFPQGGGGVTQFRQATTQTRGAAGLTDGPIPRFTQGATVIGRPFTQFGPQMTTQTQRVTTGGFNNAAMMAARQRQMAMMRARQQAAAAGLTGRTAFNGFGAAQGQVPIMMRQQNAGVFPPFAPQQIPPRDMQIAAQGQVPIMMRQQNAGVFPPFAPQQIPPRDMQIAAQRPMMIPHNAGVIPPFAPQQAPSDMNIVAAQRRAQQNQQAMARIRASGGLPPFAFMNGQAGQARSQFGMFPGGFQRQTIQTNATTTGGTAAGALWRPDMRMPGMIRPPGGAMPPPGFPGMFPPGFIGGGGTNRITTRGGQTGFTGASNALNPNFPTPILNPRDPRIGVMPTLGNLVMFGNQQQPFPFPAGAAAARAASNRLNTVSRTTTRTQTNNAVPSFQAAIRPRNIAGFNGVSRGGGARVPQTVATFPGAGQTITTITETKTITDGVPDTVAAFPGTAGSTSSVTSVNVGDVPAFPGSGSTGTAETTSTITTSGVGEVPAFPGMETGGNVALTETSSSSSSGFPVFPAGEIMSMDSGATTVDSGSPMSFSLTVQGGEEPFGPGEIPPPPPVFPARDINSIPTSADAVLFGSSDVASISTGSSGSSLGSETSSSSSSSSSTISGSGSSTSTSGSLGLDMGSTAGNAGSTVEVTKIEETSFTSGTNADIPSFPDVPSFPGISSAVETVSNTGLNAFETVSNTEGQAAPVDTLPIVGAVDIMTGEGASTGASSSVTTSETSVSSFQDTVPGFPGVDSFVNPGGVPSKS